MPNLIGPASLTVESVDVSYVVLVRAFGQLNASTAPQITLALLPLESRHVELDLSHVSAMDSATLVPLMNHQRRSEAAGGCLRFVDLSPAVVRALVLTPTPPAPCNTPGPSHP